MAFDTTKQAVLSVLTITTLFILGTLPAIPQETASKSGSFAETNRSLPTLFIVGDSTVHNPSRGQLGWGDVIAKYFDSDKIKVDNRALGGRSSRTFITEGSWEKVLASSKPGDFVLVQMGHNDGGAINEEPPGSKYPLRARGTIRGLGEETQEIDNVLTKQHEVVHTYGWYLRKYISDAHAKGMTLILCTPIPHCPTVQVKPGEVEKSDYVRMSAAVAEMQMVPLVNINLLTMNQYAKLSPAEIKEKYFTPADNTHTSPAGADLNAQSVIEGLRRLTNSPLAAFIRDGSQASADSTSSPATITDKGNLITIANGLVSLTLAKRGGQTSSMKYWKDGQYVELGNGKNALYFDVDGGKVYPVSNAEAKIIKSGPDVIEIAYAGAPTASFPFASELHVVIRRGEPGFYVYAVYQHGPGMAAGGIGETRFVVRGRPDASIFTNHVVDDDRMGAYPTAENVRTMQDATWQLADGSYYTKYNNSAFMADHHVHGMAGHGLGVWMIMPSTEYIGGGPFKQELTVHKDNVLLAMLVGGHFGSGGLRFAKDESWDKVYGPVFVYFNQGATINDMWKDAKERAASEIARWPYEWLQRDDYPLQRAAVTGHLKMSNNPSPKGAWAMLVPPDENWTQVIKGYDFWTRVAEDGRFQFTGMRPGKYALVFSGADQFEEFHALNVEIKAGDTDLGECNWQPAQHGIKLWQIGVADRSSGEFKGGDDFRHYENYLRYATNFPDDVTYVVGQSNARDDWNFAQWTWYNRVPYWTIQFALTNASEGRATLTMGFASVIPSHSQKSHLAVKVNDHLVSTVELPKSGMAGYRSGNQDSVYNVVSIPFDASLLHTGKNQITLGHTDAERFPPPEKQKGVPGEVMYDAIRLEIDADSPP